MRHVAGQDVLNHRIQPSRISTRPLYLQARDAIAQRIAVGEWRPTTAIPNEGVLARELGVSPGTMRKALDMLELERLLTRRQGRGTFVNDQSAGEHATRYNKLRGRGGEAVRGEVRVLTVMEANASERECVRLRLRSHDKVHRIRRLRSSEGKPYLLEDLAMPASLFPQLAGHQDGAQRLVVLAQRFGVLLGRGEERVTIGSAAPDAALALQVAPAATIMVLDRVIYTLEEKAAEWRLGQCLVGGRYYLAEFN